MGNRPFSMGGEMITEPTSSGPLAGRRVLVIEDEYFLAEDIVQSLAALGARIVGPYGDLGEATAAVDGNVAIDAAIVDINLRNEMALPLARVLRSRNVPLVFTSGYDRSSIEPEFQDVRLWSKPLDLKALAQELTTIIQRS
jgi:CheY-like chemotaxis protein